MGIEEVVVRIKDIARLTYPAKNYFSKVNNNISRRESVRDFRLITESILKFMPVPDLSKIVAYSEVNNEETITAIIIEALWYQHYYDEIAKSDDRLLINKISIISSSIISDVSEIDIINDCRDRLKKLDMIELEAINDPIKIENILSSLEFTDSRYYETSLTKLIPFYRNQIDKFNSTKEFDVFFDNKNERNIIFKNTKVGEDFLDYFDKCWIKVFKKEATELVETSNSYDKLIETRKKLLYQEYRDRRFFQRLQVKYTKKISKIIGRMIRSEITDDECRKLYTYRPKRETIQFLKKWLSVTPVDSISNILIFDYSRFDTQEETGIVSGIKELIFDTFRHELSFNEAYEIYVTKCFIKTDPDLINDSQKRVAAMFLSKKSFSDICEFIKAVMYEYGTYQLVKKINKDEEIINIIINRIKSATITELINNLQIINFAGDNQKLAKAYNYNFFRMDPSFEEIQSYKSNLPNTHSYIVDDFNRTVFNRDKQKIELAESPSEMLKAYEVAEKDNNGYENKVAAIQKIYQANFNN